MKVARELNGTPITISLRRDCYTTCLEASMCAELLFGVKRTMPELGMHGEEKDVLVIAVENGEHA